MRRDDLLDLNDVLQHPGRKVTVDVVTELPEEADLDLVKPLEGYLEAISTGNLLLVSGKFAGRAIFECSRCAAPIEQDLEFEIEEQFNVDGTPSGIGGQDFARVAPDDEPFALFDDNSLIVEALIRQSLGVALPMQVLCEFGWDGPCPVAAAQGAIAQTQAQGRPEFSKLSNLLKHEDEEA